MTGRIVIVTLAGSRHLPDVDFRTWSVIMVNTQVILTYQDYVELPDDKRYEIIDGELYEMAAPTFRHQEILANLHLIFGPYVRGNLLGVVLFAPIDVILADESVVRPDLIFVDESRRNIIEDHGIVGAPDLALEILSPSTVNHDLVRKSDLYARYGVDEYWTLDPETETIQVRRLEDGDYAAGENHDSGVISTSLIPGLEVRVSAVFVQS